MRSPGRRAALNIPPLAALALTSLVLAACTPTSGRGDALGSQSSGQPASYTPPGAFPGAVHIDFKLPRRSRPSFFALPWPSELSRSPSGAIDWSAFPGKNKLLIAGYIATASTDSGGYSVSPTIYFHFTSPPATQRLPSNPAGTMSAHSPVLLVDVDPASPERGAFVPLELRYFTTRLRYVPEGTLAVKPLPGFVLRPGTLYAAAVRRDLGDPAGRLLGTTDDLEAIKWTSPRPSVDEERARLIHHDALNYLGERGVARPDIAAIALFRTGVPHALSARLFEAATRLPPALAPRLTRAEWQESARGSVEGSLYHTIRGYYCTPNFQSAIESAPFLAGGGTIQQDPAGYPRVVEIPAGSDYRTTECGGLIRARFVLSVPNAPTPAGGWPLLVVGHGTGGDADDFLGASNFAGWAARQGIAAVATDQPLHGRHDRLGARPGSREMLSMGVAGLPFRVFRGQSMGSELAFYNPMNAGAARDNLRQAGVDMSMLARALAFADLSRSKRPGSNEPVLRTIPGRPAPRFDAKRILLAGHSQGSQSAAAQATLDPLVRGVVLSGCGGDTRLGILRRNDIDAMPLLMTLLELEPGELSEFHPFMTLVQSLIDPVDPQSYARLYREPLPGRRHQNVLHIGGLLDTYSPPETAAALAVALRATPLRPLLAPVRGLSLLGLSPAEGTLRGNAAGGRATIAYAQLAPTMGEDGHFVLYFEPSAPALAMQFMRSAIEGDEGPAEVGPAPAWANQAR